MNRALSMMDIKQLGRNCLAFLESSLDLFIPLDEFQDPMDRLRSRSLGLVMAATLIVNVTQTWNAITFDAPRVVVYGNFAALVLCLFIVGVLRILQPKADLAALAICSVVTIEGLLDFWLGRSPITPFITWYPLYVFLVITISGPRWGLLAAVQMLVISALHLYFSMHLPHPFLVSGNAAPEAYVKRLQAAIFLSSALAYILVSLYEYFFHATLDDLASLQSGKSQRKRLQLLGEFANGIARELEQPLNALEQLAEEMRAVQTPEQLDQALPRIKESRLNVLKITQTTQRYLMLSAGRHNADHTKMPLRELVNFVVNFPSRLRDGSRQRALTHGIYDQQFISHAVGRLVILVLCSALNRIEGPLRGRLHALTFQELNDDFLFTLIFVQQSSENIQADFRELLADFNLTLEAVRGHTRLQLPESANGPAAIILRVPREL